MSELMQSPALPKITATKDRSHWRVDWDYQEAPESKILFEKSEFLDGFIDGVLVTLAIPSKQVSCASGRTGTVKKLNEETAKRLVELLEYLLHPIVKNHHKRLVNASNVPHVRFLPQRSDDRELSA